MNMNNERQKMALLEDNGLRLRVFPTFPENWLQRPMGSRRLLQKSTTNSPITPSPGTVSPIRKVLSPLARENIKIYRTSQFSR